MLSTSCRAGPRCHASCFTRLRLLDDGHCWKGRHSACWKQVCRAGINPGQVAIIGGVDKIQTPARGGRVCIALWWGPLAPTAEISVLVMQLWATLWCRA
jgi:hypothetical protein